MAVSTALQREYREKEEEEDDNDDDDDEEVDIIDLDAYRITQKIYGTLMIQLINSTYNSQIITKTTANDRRAYGIHEKYYSSS